MTELKPDTWDKSMHLIMELEPASNKYTFYFTFTMTQSEQHASWDLWQPNEDGFYGVNHTYQTALTVAHTHYVR